MNDKQKQTTPLGFGIRFARKELGLTQKQLAERLNITPTIISEWETGARNPKISSLQKIADILGLSITELCNFESPKINNQTFGNRLRTARKAKCMTQSELADKCHCMDVQIRKYESGQNDPSLSKLIQLARALDVSLDWICGLTDNSPQHIELQTKIQEAEKIVNELRDIRDKALKACDQNGR